MQRSDLMDIARIIVENSDGRARLAYQEEDNSSDMVPDAAHFIKVDEKRIGRDIELYGFFTEIEGWEPLLPRFLMEVLMPIKALGLSQSYERGGEKLKALGHTLYSEEHLSAWDELF